jgi:hypothetical protein
METEKTNSGGEFSRSALYACVEILQ